MDKLEFTDKMKSGIDRIDQQHQFVVEEVNKLLSYPAGTMSEDFVRASLGKIRLILQNHFAEEEKLLKDLSISIPFVSANEHRAIITSLDNFVGKLEEDFCVSDELKLFVIGTLSAYLMLEADQIKRALKL